MLNWRGHLHSIRNQGPLHQLSHAGANTHHGFTELPMEAIHSEIQRPIDIEDMILCVRHVENQKVVIQESDGYTHIQFIRLTIQDAERALISMKRFR